MNKIHTWQNTMRPILFSGSNVFARLDRIHSMTDCFLFYSPMLACQNTDVFSDVFPMDHIWNLPFILTPADKDLLRAWQAKWVVTSSCSICNSVDGIFEAFLAVVCSSNGAIGGLPTCPSPIKNCYLKYWHVLSLFVNTPWDRCTTHNINCITDPSNSDKASHFRHGSKATPDLWDKNDSNDMRVLLRQNQQEMGHLIAPDSLSAFFRKMPAPHYSCVT